MTNKLDILMTLEFQRTEKMHQTPEAKKLAQTQKAMLKEVKSIGQSGDMDLILKTEQHFLKSELDRFAHGPAMKTSLKTGISELDIARDMLPIVADKDAYQKASELFKRPKNRRRGVPHDEARQSLASHNTRLMNVDKGRMSPTEREVVSARRVNIKTVEKLYKTAQEKALGIQPDQKQAKAQNKGKGMAI